MTYIWLLTAASWRLSLAAPERDEGLGLIGSPAALSCSFLIQLSQGKDRQSATTTKNTRRTSSRTGGKCWQLICSRLGSLREFLGNWPCEAVVAGNDSSTGTGMVAGVRASPPPRQESLRAGKEIRSVRPHRADRVFPFSRRALPPSPPLHERKVRLWCPISRPGPTSWRVL